MYIARTFSSELSFITRRDVQSLPDALERFLAILFEDILPLWSTLGLDHTCGGFCESIAGDGTVPQTTRRVRVSARQVYAFSQAARFGYNPAVATACIRHGDRFLQNHSSEDGLISHSISADGACVDAGHDLYDQAFLLFSYASAYGYLDDQSFRTRGLALLSAIRQHFGHAAGGFCDRTDKPYPLRANPHMHLLEAALAWMAIDDDPAWPELADEVVALFQSSFFDPSTGVVREIFTPQWKAIAEDGRYRVEPGHNYEWAWLLLRWQALTGGDTGAAPVSMVTFAEAYGYDPVRKVAMNECWSDGSSCDSNARLWPQTERLKAWLALAKDATGRSKQHAEDHALDAAVSLLGYFNRDTCRGLWRDVMLADGTLQSGVAPASSLYHIICAVGELCDYVRESDSFASAPTSAILVDRPLELPV